MAVKKGDLAMRDAVDEFLRSMKASGEYKRLFQKWFAPMGGDAPGMAKAAVKNNGFAWAAGS